MRENVVIKLGGASLGHPRTTSELISLIQELHENNFKVVVVHGGGPAINEELTKRGISWKFINGQRQTTLEMMNVITEVLAEKVNSQLVQALYAGGIHTVGLSGAEDQILFCSQSDAQLMQVGKIEKVNAEKLKKYLLPDIQVVPVVAPLGFGSQNEHYNINADWAAAKIAIELKATALYFLTDQDGVLDENKNQFIDLNTEQALDMIQNQIIHGGMQTKVLTMIAALNGGIKDVRVLNAGCASQVCGPLQTGTRITEKASQFQNNLSEGSVTWNLSLN